MLTSTDRGRLIALLSGISSDLITAEISDQPGTRARAIRSASAVIDDLLRELQIEQLEAAAASSSTTATEGNPLERLAAGSGAVTTAIGVISGWRPRSTKDRALAAMEQDYLRRGAEMGRFPEEDGIGFAGDGGEDR